MQNIYQVEFIFIVYELTHLQKPKNSFCSDEPIATYEALPCRRHHFVRRDPPKESFGPLGQADPDFVGASGMSVSANYRTNKFINKIKRLELARRWYNLKIITCLPACPLKRSASGSAYGLSAARLRKAGTQAGRLSRAVRHGAEHDSVRRHLAPIVMLHSYLIT